MVKNDWSEIRRAQARKRLEQEGGPSGVVAVIVIVGFFGLVFGFAAGRLL